MANDASAVPDCGPWAAQALDDNRVVLSSHDFNHDVQLHVNGDFAYAGERLAYAQYLARLLTEACAREQARQCLPDTQGLLATLTSPSAAASRELLLQAADEISRLRNALAHADHALEQLHARQHLRLRVQEAAAPSPFALALQAALYSAKATKA